MSRRASAGTLFGPLLKVGIAAAAIALGTIQLVVSIEIARSTVTIRQMADFGIFYRSAARVSQGRGNPYDVIADASTPATSRAPNLNPPHALLLMVPLTWMSQAAALGVWTAASIASAVWAVVLIFRELRIRVTLSTVAWTVFLLLCAAPTGTVLLFAQISWLLWGPITWAWRSARRGHWVQAAIVLGVAASIKPFLGIFVLVFAVERRWRAAVAATITGLACVLSGIVALGWPTFVAWTRALRSVVWAEHVFNASIYGFLERLLTRRDIGPVWYQAPLADLPSLVQPLWIIAGLAVLALSLRSLRGDDDADHTFGVTLAAALLLSPLGWIYYFFFLAAPLAALGLRIGANRPRPIVVAGLTGAALLLCLSPGVVASGQPSGWATLTLGSAYFWALVSLWILAARAPAAGRIGV